MPYSDFTAHRRYSVALSDSIGFLAMLTLV